MIQNYAIVIGETAEKTPSIRMLYLGRDAVAAEKVYRAAGQEFIHVDFHLHPLPVMSRYPVNEQFTIEEGKAHAKRQADAQDNRLKTIAEQKRAAANAALAEAEQAELRADPRLQKIFSDMQKANLAVEEFAQKSAGLRAQAEAAGQVAAAATDEAMKSQAQAEHDNLIAQAEAAQAEAAQAADTAEELEAQLQGTNKKKQRRS